MPYAAGGAVDVLARTLGQSLAKTWGQQPIIENRPGAGGIVASQALTQAPPDGYTLILVASGHPLNQFIYPSLPYDTFKDFTAISEIASSPLAILVSKKSPYATLQDLLAAARKDPDSLSYGMSGNGTSAHLAGELLKYMAGVKIVAIPYKGGAPALTAVMAGDIPISINPLAEVVGQIEGGQLRAIAVTSAQPSKTLPDVATVAASGVPGYDVSVWWGFLGPARMPPELVKNRVAGSERPDDSGKDRRDAGRQRIKGLRGFHVRGNSKMGTRAESGQYSGAVRTTTGHPTPMTGPDHDDTI